MALNPKELRPRDSQRQRLYDAERVIHTTGRRFDTRIHGTHEGGFEQPKAEDLAALRSYVERLTNSAWFRRRWAINPVSVRWRNGTRSGGVAFPGAGEIAIGSYGATERVVLHEIAHLCVNANLDIAWHGREFAACYLELVRHQMGDEAWRALKAAFVKHRVRHTARRVLTPEQRDAARERLLSTRRAASA